MIKDKEDIKNLALLIKELLEKGEYETVHCIKTPPMVKVIEAENEAT